MSAIDLLLDPKMRADVLRVVNSPEFSKKLGGNDLEIAKKNLNDGELSKTLALVGDRDAAALLEDRVSREAIGNALDPITEAIILFAERPVLKVINNTYEAPSSEEVAKNLNGNRAKVEKAIPAVGRIEVRNHSKYSWIGTGWLVAEDVVVTNRHVAVEFAKKQANQHIEFLRNHHTRKEISAYIDLREEFIDPRENDHREEIEFLVKEVLFISDDDAFDIAFLRVWKEAFPSGTPLPDPIKLAEYDPAIGSNVAVIGYPARDSRSPTPQDMERIFGSIYNVKRLAPGEVIRSTRPEAPGILEHDCTTLGGNSGGLVLDITTGEAVGLHYAGIHRTANLAVSSIKVAEALAALGINR